MFSAVRQVERESGKGFYKLINRLNQNLGIIFFALISKVCSVTNNFQVLMTELES